MDKQEAFEGWAVVEVMGHQTFAGYASETQIAGAGMLRIDVPGTEAVPAFTKLIAPSALYGITPVDETYARQAAESLRKRPVEIYMPNLCAAPTTRALPVGEEDLAGLEW